MKDQFVTIARNTTISVGVVCVLISCVWFLGNDRSAAWSNIEHNSDQLLQQQTEIQVIRDAVMDQRETTAQIAESLRNIERYIEREWQSRHERANDGS